MVGLSLCQVRSLHNELRSCFADAVALARASGQTVPAVAEFWQRHFGSRRSVAVCGCVGSDVGKVFEDLTEVAVTDATLRQHPVEADSIPEPRWLSLDGTLTPYTAPMPHEGDWAKQVPGRILGGASVCAVLLDASPTGRQTRPHEWPDRCGIAIVVSSAATLLGSPETRIIEILSAAHRELLLVVTGLSEAPASRKDDAFAEMERRRIAPLRKRVGEFPVVQRDENREWIDYAHAWALRTADRAAITQSISVFMEWTDRWLLCVREQMDEERRVAERLTAICDHLALQHDRYGDVLSRAVTKAVLSIERARDNLALAARSVPHDHAGNGNDTLDQAELRLCHVREAWEGLSDVIHGVTRQVQEEIADEWLDDSTRFSRAYAPPISERPLRLQAVPLPVVSCAVERWDELSWDDIVALAERACWQQEEAESSMTQMATDLVAAYLAPAADRVVEALKRDATTVLSPHAMGAAHSWSAAIAGELESAGAALMAVQTHSELIGIVQRMAAVRERILGGIECVDG